MVHSSTQTSVATDKASGSEASDETQPAATSARTFFLGFENAQMQSDTVAGVEGRGQADETDIAANGKAYMQPRQNTLKNESRSSSGAGSFARAERSGARRHRVLRWLLGRVDQG
jgi:hypothetical protein